MPEKHPDFAKRCTEMAGAMEVHGCFSVEGASHDRIHFDCNHGHTDLVPYAAFAASKSDKKILGALGNAAPPAAAGSGAHSPAGASRLSLPTVGSGSPLASRLATYKDYHFVRCELEKLVKQIKG